MIHSSLAFEQIVQKLQENYKESEIYIHPPLYICNSFLTAQVFPHEGEHHRRAYNQTRIDFLVLHAEVIGKSSNMGHVSLIVIGEEF